MGAILHKCATDRRTQSLTCVVCERSAKLVRWFLDADDDPNSHQNLIIMIWPIYSVLEICIQIYSVVFALSQQINKQKVCENN